MGFSKFVPVAYPCFLISAVQLEVNLGKRSAHPLRKIETDVDHKYSVESFSSYFMWGTQL